MRPGPLAGVGVLVTRPVHQAGKLADLVRNLGGEPVLFPALEIEPLAAAEVVAACSPLEQFDFAVFVSPNAARLAMAALSPSGGLPPKTRVAAVGPGTAAELKKSGVREIITADSGFDSEALLVKLPQEKICGKRVAIFRGQDGRALLGDRLRERGATVEYVECYRRVKPGRDMASLLPLWERGELRACVATSAEIVDNLFDMAGAAGRPSLCQTPFLVSHPRVAGAAFNRGVRTVFVAGAGDQALAAGLETWFARLRPIQSAA